MKKLISVILAACLLISLLPFSVSAAEADSESTGVNWSYDEGTKTLTISGSGNMDNYYKQGLAPWNDKLSEVEIIKIGGGITSVGDYSFYGAENVYKVELPDSLERIGHYAFYKNGLVSAELPENLKIIGAYAFAFCEDMTSVNIPDGMTEIGTRAFLATNLASVSIPADLSNIGFYAFGYDNNGSKIQDFAVYGYTGSGAATFAVSNSFIFIDLNSEEYDVVVISGKAWNMMTRQWVTKARAGEKIKVYPNLNKYDIFDGITTETEGLVIDEYGVFFMPEKNVFINVEHHSAISLTIDFSYSDTVELAEESASFLKSYFAYAVVYSGATPIGYDLDNDGSADVQFTGSTVKRLATSSINSSVGFDTHQDYSPVTFVFAPNLIEETWLDVTIPQAGDTYDYEHDQAEVTTYYNQYTVVSAKWFNEWGIAEPVFEEGRRYHVEMEIKPNDYYAFSMLTDFYINGTAKKPWDMSSDGTVSVSSKDFTIPGGLHMISVSGGLASSQSDDYEGYHRITEARAGDIVYVCPDGNDLGDDEYIVQNSMEYYSDDVEITGEAAQYFVMGTEDVEVEVTYEKRKLLSCEMDLRNGAEYKPPESNQGGQGYVTSQIYGIYIILQKMSEDAHSEYDESLGVFKYEYDIDGDGTFDVAFFNGTYKLLNTSSLSSASGRITLKLRRSECFTVPMQSLTIIFADPTSPAHSIFVNGGLAYISAKGDKPVTEAYKGEWVTLKPDFDTLADNQYIVQLTAEASSKDVEIYGESWPAFTMPNKNVNISYVYDVGEQISPVLDLTNGKTYIASQDGRYAESEVYGIYFVLHQKSKRQKFEYSAEEGGYINEFDIDGCGGYDIGFNQAKRSFYLLDTCTLIPASGRVTLSLSREESYTVPARRITLILAGEHTPHKITVNSGFASSKSGDYGYRITQQYNGEVVYILADPAQVPEGKYIKSMTVTSNDVEIVNADCPYFVMPDKNVKITVNYTLANKKAYTLNLSTGEKTVGGEFYNVERVLRKGSKISDEYTDEALNSVCCDYDIDGDGRTDIKCIFGQNKFVKVNNNLKGGVLISLKTEQACIERCCPLTVLFGNALVGDVNLDGVVNVADATALQRHLAEFSGAEIDLNNQDIKTVADVKADEIIDVRDVTAIQRIAAELA